MFYLPTGNASLILHTALSRVSPSPHTSFLSSLPFKQVLPLHSRESDGHLPLRALHTHSSQSCSRPYSCSSLPLHPSGVESNFLAVRANAVGGQCAVPVSLLKDFAPSASLCHQLTAFATSPSLLLSPRLLIFKDKHNSLDPASFCCCCLPFFVAKLLKHSSHGSLHSLAFLSQHHLCFQQ